MIYTANRSTSPLTPTIHLLLAIAADDAGRRVTAGTDTLLAALGRYIQSKINLSGAFLFLNGVDVQKNQKRYQVCVCVCARARACVCCVCVCEICFHFERA
jgi:hypothetical protein